MFHVKRLSPLISQLRANRWRTETSIKVLTQHFIGRSTHASFSRCAPRSTVVSYVHVASNAFAFGSRLDEASQHVSRVLKHCACSAVIPPSHVLAQRRSAFPDRLETERGISCIDPGGGGWFGRVAEQSPFTGYEPNSLIQISSAHTPINFACRRNSFSADCNDVPTVAASDATDTLGLLHCLRKKEK